jgi:hypothetical protein
LLTRGKATGQLLRQLTCRGGLHLGHHRRQRARPHGRRYRQANVVAEGREHPRRLFRTHGGIDGDQAIVLGLLLLADLTQQLLHLGLDGLQRLDAGIQLLLGGRHQWQHGRQIGIPRIQLGPARLQRLQDPQFSGRNSRLLRQLLRRQGTDGGGRFHRGRSGDRHGFLSPGLGPLE